MGDKRDLKADFSKNKHFSFRYDSLVFSDKKYFFKMGKKMKESDAV